MAVTFTEVTKTRRRRRSTLAASRQIRVGCWMWGHQAEPRSQQQLRVRDRPWLPWTRRCSQSASRARARTTLNRKYGVSYRTPSLPCRHREWWLCDGGKPEDCKCPNAQMPKCTNARQHLQRMAYPRRLCPSCPCSRPPILVQHPFPLPFPRHSAHRFQASPPAQRTQQQWRPSLHASTAHTRM